MIRFSQYKVKNKTQKNHSMLFNSCFVRTQFHMCRIIGLNVLKLKLNTLKVL